MMDHPNFKISSYCRDKLSVKLLSPPPLFIVQLLYFGAGKGPGFNYAQNFEAQRHDLQRLHNLELYSQWVCRNERSCCAIFFGGYTEEDPRVFTIN